MGHEWTYDEFVKHREHGIHPGSWVDHTMFEESHPEMAEKLRPKLTDEHHEFRAKSDEEKQAHYDEWISTHREEHEQRERERTFSYRMYHFFFHWRDGLVISSLLMAKVLAV